MAAKSDRLRKLENELADLEQWLKLSLVPKKDIEKHQQEIQNLQTKIMEEKKRIAIAKEGGEEYVPPKKTTQKAGYESPDIEVAESGGGMTEVNMETETETYETTSYTESTEVVEEKTQHTEEDDPFSDKNRWKRGILDDQDTSQW